MLKTGGIKMAKCCFCRKAMFDNVSLNEDGTYTRVLENGNILTGAFVDGKFTGECTVTDSVYGGLILWRMRSNITRRGYLSRTAY
jgi:hypothetical protein